ncbi:mitochondrial sodium/calcium exchanger protein [Drosophila eugracilis]|uniref:mitochondrial sodium/calcium exchanger protein n=1 Tax=Drosophila eugracilis TaxID=29029 RepID=UPI0007E5EC89|nr:mitochondrial sodium/calcium exchanger protein [Drosophila eugracilis]
MIYLKTSGNLSSYGFLNVTNFLQNVSCWSVMNIHYIHRCEMASRMPDCRYISNFFNYFLLMYCTFKINNKITEVLVLLMFALLYCLFLCIVYVAIGNYFLPTLKIAALRLRINEYLAGVLLVGVATATPDLLVNTAPVRAQSYTFNIAMSSCLTIICLSGGAVCFIRPFKMNGHCVFRDLLFLLFVVELVRLFIKDTYLKPWVKGVMIMVIYPVYIIINIVDMLLLRLEIRKLRRDVEYMRQSQASIQHNRVLAEKVVQLATLEEEDEIQFFETKLFGKKTFKTGFFVTPKPLIRHKEIDVESNRIALHSKDNSKNLFLFSDFFHAINPINPEVWYLSGGGARFLIVLTAPVNFMLRLLIPYVDYQRAKHGWTKLLNCLQIVLTPFVSTSLVESMIYNRHSAWYTVPQFKLAVWTLVITVPLAITVFINSRTDIPPSYQFLYVVISIPAVIILCWICAWEMDALITIMGIGLDLEPSFMSITFNTVSGAAADFISHVHLAEHGYGKMAFGAIIGGSVFNIVINVGTELVKQTKLDANGQVILFDTTGETIYIFLVITIVTTLWWSLTFNFVARRSAGVFMWSLFILFIFYSVAIEFEWVHGFEDSPHIVPS